MYNLYILLGKCENDENFQKKTHLDYKKIPEKPYLKTPEEINSAILGP